jgi:uncharacterized protein
MQKFLTAKWHDLIMVNYEVPRSLLKPRLPLGTELDLEDGRCYVSLVGFMFLDVRVFGFLVPFHINFEEVNLRFYVTRTIDDEVRRGVVFVKEIVPRSAIALVARTLYDEPYQALSMWNKRDDRSVEYGWSEKGVRNTISVPRGAKIGIPDPGSHAEFIIEHYWGYTKRKGNRTDEYKVEHPKWDLFEAGDVKVDVDFKTVYGDEFAFLSDAKPYSVLLAHGSEVAVYKGEQV